MIQYVAHIPGSKKLSDVLLPQNVTILEMSNVFSFQPDQSCFSGVA
jgi:hypothetical protein